MESSEQSPREIGLALLDATQRFDIPIAIRQEELRAVAIRTLLGRARRLLRAAFVLGDADMALEAMILNRSLVEFAITLSWLLHTEDSDLAILQWNLDDVAGRLKIHNHLIQLAGVAVYGDDELQHLEEGKASILAQMDGRPEAMPSFLDRAIIGKLEHVYASAYRSHSQAAAHPTVWATEQLMESMRHQDGEHLVVHPDVPRSRPTLDPYNSTVRLYGLMVVLAAEDGGDFTLANRVREVCADLLDADAALDPAEE